MARRNTDMHWYAVSAWTNRLAELRADLIALGIDHYIPCEIVERNTRNRVVITQRPVWPGYAFVCIEPRQIGTVMGVEVVHDFIRANGEPVTLPANALVPVVLAEVFGDLDHTRKPKPYKPERGQQARVKSGKWKGYLGRILSVGKHKVLMETKWCKLEVGAEDLEKAA
jgi:transcription antitermination factor NusG